MQFPAMATWQARLPLRMRRTIPLRCEDMVYPTGLMPPSVSTRPTRIVVNLDALSHNLRSIRAHTGVPVMAIVKANAYGHGLVP
ncbi:MAG TPA: alanine racemase, partial [Lysobacter sp.]|nr:alanine racemase [Lysobacter sp.]